MLLEGEVDAVVDVAAETLAMVVVVVVAAMAKAQRAAATLASVRRNVEMTQVLGREWSSMMSTTSPGKMSGMPMGGSLGADPSSMTATGMGARTMSRHL